MFVSGSARSLWIEMAKAVITNVRGWVGLREEPVD